MGDYAKALGAKLRAIRQQQGLSLHGVEQKSGGRWKAVVVGSYERGDRAVTVQKLAELADFYGVPVNELLPEDWLIGYLQGNVTLGYILPLFRGRPTPLLTAAVTAGGATFFYFELKGGSGQNAPTLPLNWDLLWAAHVALTLPL